MGAILGVIGLIIALVVLSVPVVLVAELCKSFAHRMGWDEENELVQCSLTIAVLLVPLAIDMLIFWFGGFAPLPEDNFAKEALEAVAIYTGGFASLIAIYLIGKFLFLLAVISFSSLNKSIRGE